MKKAVLFDLGNTLVRYFGRAEFPTILEQAIHEVRAYLQGKGFPTIPPEALWQRVGAEDYEAEDHRVRPLEGRLTRIFQLDPVQAEGVAEDMCRCFTGPIFACGQRYPDALPALESLRSKGIKTAIVSNTPWGSPGALWREELERLGLDAWVDAAVFCTDVGWRKPARAIFQYALERLQVEPLDSLFVGDDPRWDLAGPRALGMDAILIDRHGAFLEAAGGAIQTLDELGGKRLIAQKR
jgi:putative hydrolase of the HAD superfamily